MTYTLTIGLEVHIKLRTDTKIFCGCANVQDFDTVQPNSLTCPVCTAQPGATPVLQAGPLEQALRLGKLLGCQISDHSSFDRKSYFYPDMPSGYQITQFYNPTCTDGQISFFLEDYQTSHTVAIEQAHMETDTGKTIHDGTYSLIDYNRAGGPLVEIVTAPDFHSVDEVIGFLKELQRLVRYNTISDADMEKGQMRADVNISLSKTETLGVRTEVKNMASFSAIRKAIEYEYERQTIAIDNGDEMEQETRGWDDEKTFVMRKKSDVLDYRYFPDPDLPVLEIEKTMSDEIDTFVGITTYKRINERIALGFHKEYINGLLQDKETSDFYQSFVDQGCDASLVVKWLVGPLAAYTKEHLVTRDALPLSFDDIKSFFDVASSGKLRENQLKVVMDEMLATGHSVAAIVQEKGFDAPALDEDELLSIIKQVINDNPAIVEQYKAGKESVIGFFVGQVMKKTQGKADPKKVPGLVKGML